MSERRLDARAYMLTVQIKMQAEALQKLIEQLYRETDIDARWVNIGHTHLQQGIMALDRAVRRPLGF